MPTVARDDELLRALERVVASLPGGVVRPGQVTMAEAISELFARPSGRHLVVAAGTGTGKSLGYLVPALLSGRTTVVATATLALQDQLATKDLPLVAASIGRPVRFAVMKGRANYICRQRIAEIERAGENERLDLAGAMPDRPSRRRRSGGATTAEEVVRLVRFAGETASGDRAELDFEPSPAAWSSVSVGADECPGAHRCPQGADCFAERARAKAARADVVVVNHHLLGASLRAGGGILPEHEALVVDEAHELEDILAASLGVDAAAGRVRAVASTARHALTAAGGTPAAAEAVMDGATRFEAALASSPEARLPSSLGGELGPAVRLLVDRLGRLSGELRRHGDGEKASGEAAQRCIRALLVVDHLSEDLRAVSTATSETVVWVSGDERRRLRSAPLEVGPALRELVFTRLPVVLTSATMMPGLGERLGAPAGSVSEIDVGSPFDYRTQALLYCATSLPDRRRAGGEERLLEELEALILAAEGRTLALFTSRRAMVKAASHLRPRVPWPIHVQGDLPKPALVNAFAGEEESCLFATMGYWQGVDVPGATLSLVVIDKIPFPRPDDPLFSARRQAAGGDGFRLVDVPRAAALLAQGAGRLIRTASDRGVVAVLDPRLATAAYSGYLVKALPPMRRTRSREEAVSFLSSLRRGEGDGVGAVAH